MNETEPRIDVGPIVVGFKPELNPAIIDSARFLATSFRCDVIFVYVQQNVGVYAADPLGTWYIEPAVTEIDDETNATALELADTLAAALDPSGVTWSLRVLIGDPSSALAWFGEEVGARMFIVGTRRPGAVHRLEEMLAGSVAKALAMGQSRPVLLVPMARKHEQRQQAPLEA